MTSGEQGKKGFQPVYDPNDFIDVLDETPVKTATVKERLIKRNQKKYEKIHYDWVKKTLIKLLDAGKISGGKDEELNIFLWKKKNLRK